MRVGGLFSVWGAWNQGKGYGTGADLPAPTIDAMGEDVGALVPAEADWRVT
jgi:hypothetical protein